MISLALDPGYGNVKLYGSSGSVIIQSAVSVGGRQQTGRMTGLRMAKCPMRIETALGAFYVGKNAHDWGRPVENLDLDRLTGSPELMALWYGVLTKYGVPDDPVDLIVGLPIRVLMGDDAKATQQAVRSAFRGKHTWGCDGEQLSVLVNTTRTTSQPVGAMFDYLLDDEGQMAPSRRAVFKGEIGILSLGMNTLDLLVVRNGSPVQRFTAGETLGVRRLLELANRDGTYSLAERDAQLRSGALDISSVCSIWQSEVLGFIEKQWGNAYRRFGAVVIVGGGASFLREALMRRFKEKTYSPDDPVIATARGLYKYTLMKARRNLRGKARPS